MSVEVEVVEIAPGIQIVEITQPELTSVELIGGGGGGTSNVARLDDLDDVEDADAGSPGSVLMKSGSGQWVPATPSGVDGLPGPTSYTYEQVEPSTVWLVGHPLGFRPAGIQVRDHMDVPQYPVVSYIDDWTVRLDFNTSIRGTAHLS